MAEDERRTKLWMLQIDCLFYFHLQLRHSSSVSGLRWPCQSTAFLVFANFFLNILVQRIVKAYFSFSLLCYIRQSKKSLVQGASCHQTMLLCSLPLLRNSVKQLGECMEARGVTEALLKEIRQQVGIVRVIQAKCGFVCNSNGTF